MWPGSEETQSVPGVGIWYLRDAACGRVCGTVSPVAGRDFVKTSLWRSRLACTWPTHLERVSCCVLQRRSLAHWWLRH